MNKYDWELVFTDGRKGHSLWFDKNSQRYSIKDQSGVRPDTTDDGPLWVIVDGEAFVSEVYGLSVRLSVVVRENDISSVGCQYEFGLRVARKLGIKIVVGEKVKKLIERLKQLELYPIFPLENCGKTF